VVVLFQISNTIVVSTLVASAKFFFFTKHDENFKFYFDFKNHFYEGNWRIYFLSILDFFLKWKFWNLIIIWQPCAKAAPISNSTLRIGAYILNPDATNWFSALLCQIFVYFRKWKILIEFSRISTSYEEEEQLPKNTSFIVYL